MMRLQKVDGGHAFGAKVKLGMMSLLMEPPGMIKAQSYRPELWGEAMNRLTQYVMRGPSAWTVAERELLGAFVSSRNKCMFCMHSHGAVASKASGDEARTAAVLADYHTAPIGEGLRATLGLLEKLTLTPAEVSPADVDAVRAHGVSEEAIRDAVRVCFCLSFANRMADTLGVDLPSDKTYGLIARVLLLVGYR